MFFIYFFGFDSVKVNVVTLQMTWYVQICWISISLQVISNV